MLPYVLTAHPLARALRRPYKIVQALFACLFFRFPGRKLRVIGVTGTDGKTTTIHLVTKALESAGYTVGAISTIHYQVGTKQWVNTSKLTTPGPWQLQKLLAHMVRSGCHYVVLECSSHRLDQQGFWGIPFDVAVITNVTREHFDYHRDFEDYVRAKRRLFKALHHRPKVLRFRRGIDRGGRVPTIAIAPLDDERARRMLDEPAERKYGCTLHRPVGIDPSVTIVAAEAVAHGLAVIRAGDHEALLRLQLPGNFNLQNALAAIAVGVSQEIELARITRELSEVRGVPGRMDEVQEGQKFTVIVDYAVTPAAFEELYKVVVQKSDARILHVFGAAGQRDRGKRELLGAIAGKRAHFVILTDEDPYGEDPEQILNDLQSGVVAAGKALGETLVRIRDRRLAIREALRRARPGDVVLITGKGAEETMVVGEKRIPWNDRRVIVEELRLQART